MDQRQSQFQALVEAYSADLYRFAYWLVRDRALAEDLVQESFMRAWKAIDSLRDPKAAKGWLITILRRERARHYERAPPPSDSLDEMDLERIAGIDDGHGHAGNFALRRALADLSEDYCEPLLLQVLGGYSCEEIGELLGASPGAIMTRLSRARQKLRHALEGGKVEAARENMS
ncbi:MAG: sigma-70 family RNA polymerase sigma factor [Sulfuricaulis sp.]|nr:sigma-70 family RNA polymerase sigma factor [Sulfuricaulis sp.]